MWSKLENIYKSVTAKKVIRINYLLTFCFDYEKNTVQVEALTKLN